MEQPSVSSAMKQICDEKGISYESVLETIEAALGAAYRKDFGNKLQNLEVKFNPENGDITVFDVKTVVDDVPEEEEEREGDREIGSDKKEGTKEQKNKRTEEPVKVKAEGDMSKGEEEEERRFNPKTDIQVSEAKEIKKSYKIDDVIRTELKVPGDFGRMAAQTAKQVITQKLREAERETLYNEFKDQVGEILIGTIQRREGSVILVDLGRITAVLAQDEQISRESYNTGDHLKVYIVSVNKTTKGPEIVVSRSHPNIVRQLFATEIPEIAAGTVEIKGVSREAGSRSKIAVFTEEENIDPIGSCIGQRGSRVQTIINELRGEKIDIIEYSDDPNEFISNALSPAKITELKINNEEKTATAVVPEDQLSLAIGKSGQNVRLAAKLTGWKIDIVSEKGESEGAREIGSEGEEEQSEEKESADTKALADKEVSGSDEASEKEVEPSKKKKEEKKEVKKEKAEKIEEKEDKKDDEKKSDSKKESDSEETPEKTEEK